MQVKRLDMAHERRGGNEDSRIYSDLKVERNDKGFSGDGSKKTGEEEIRRRLTKVKDLYGKPFGNSLNCKLT